MDTPAPSRVLHYDLIEELGRSRHGITWRAFDTDTKQFVALKVFGRPGKEPVEFAQRYLPTLKVARQLIHQNLGAVRDVGEYQSAILIISDYQDGPNLNQYAQQQAMSLQQSLILASELAAGLYQIHSHGLTHGNLKPSNVIVGADGILRIIDYGLPLLLPEQGQNIDDVPTQELVYVPPECLDGERPEQQGDYYSVGALLYEAMSGRQLYCNTDRAGLLELISKGKPDFELLWSLGYPGDITLLVEQLLARSKTSRSAKPDELLITIRSISEFELRQDEVPMPEKNAHSARSYLFLSGIAIVLLIVWIVLASVR